MDSKSIHPGVVNGHRISPKVNTCGNSSTEKRLQRQHAGITKHLIDHPRDVLSLLRLSTITALLKT